MMQLKGGGQSIPSSPQGMCQGIASSSAKGTAEDSTNETSYWPLYCKYLRKPVRPVCPVLVCSWGFG